MSDQVFGISLILIRFQQDIRENLLFESAFENLSYPIPTEVVSIILATPIQRYGLAQDTWAWAHSNSAAQGSLSDLNTVHWQWVWKAQSTLRTKWILWLAIRERPSTQDRLFMVLLVMLAVCSVDSQLKIMITCFSLVLSLREFGLRWGKLLVLFVHTGSVIGGMLFRKVGSLFSSHWNDSTANNLSALCPPSNSCCMVGLRYTL